MLLHAPLPSFKPGVHHSKPQRRHHRNDDHCGIAKGKLWAFIIVIQDLIAFVRKDMVVGMALKLKEEKITEHVACIAGVLRVHLLISPR